MLHMPSPVRFAPTNRSFQPNVSFHFNNLTQMHVCKDAAFEHTSSRADGRPYVRVLKGNNSVLCNERLIREKQI